MNKLKTSIQDDQQPTKSLQGLLPAGGK